MQFPCIPSEINDTSDDDPITSIDGILDGGLKSATESGNTGQSDIVIQTRHEIQKP